MLPFAPHSYLGLSLLSLKYPLMPTSDQVIHPEFLSILKAKYGSEEEVIRLGLAQNFASIYDNLSKAEVNLDQRPDSVILMASDLINFSSDIIFESSPDAEYDKLDLFTFESSKSEERFQGAKYPSDRFPHYNDSNDDSIPDFKKRDVLEQDPASPQNPELLVMVSPVKVGGPYAQWEINSQSKEVPQAVKENCFDAKVPKDVNINNGYDFSDEEKEVHVDHTYHNSKKVQEVNVPQAPRRPVGRPRKCAALPKRYAADMEEEIVDVESIQVKRPRRAPKAKPTVSAPPKRRGRKPNNGESSNSSKSQVVASCNYITDSNGFVMRQAKNSALKKIAKSKNSSPVSRSKRNDHNDMERRRRLEMKILFDHLKVLVPTELLKDDKGKMKKNPSKNTVLIGSRQLLVDVRSEGIQKSTLLLSMSKTNKRVRKLRRRIKRRLRYQ